MAMVRRQKATIVALALYWPTLFVLAHIPVPEVVRRADVSDKSLHVLMYLILTFLLWSALKPQSKLDWRRVAPWLTLAVVLGYAVCDEYLQRFVAGRSMDAHDIVADVIGAAAAFAVLSFFSFWPAALIITGATIYTLTVFTRANLTELLPVTTTVFHLGTYGFFTLLWIACLRRRFAVTRGGRRWLGASMIAPLGMLLVTKASALISGKAFEGWDVVASAAGIFGTIAIYCFLARLRERAAKGPALSGAEA
jgi:VanZ family protein